MVSSTMRTAIPGILAFSLLLLVGSSEGQGGRGGGCITEAREAGRCVAIRNCGVLRLLLAQVQSGSAPPGSIDKLRRSICHFDRGEPLVCCPESSPVPPVNMPQPGPSTSSTPLPSRCGVQGITDRIIDGLPAPLRAWPWMVVLRGNTGGRSFWFCGGTLISDRYVLTAAHCFKPQLGVTLEFARVGEHNIREEQDCEFGVCAPPPQDIPVERTIVHPSYGSPCSECNDIALLRLSRKVTLDPLYVIPICLPQDPVREMGFSVQQFQGKFAWAAGWGTTARDPAVVSRPSILQQVQLPIQELPYCDFLKKDYPDKNMVLCAGGEGKDTCKGDSGGPLTLTNAVSTKHFLVGVTSLGPTVCGSQDTQGLYTSVHHYLPWIIQTMRP
ncbi:serine protease easter-like [Macrobrachium rosenbergii]|uniref:serine protease easter-like n=1 Tax=Macrobrachium rosenbergii TaxID=79674 RepID=UPI0034D55509